MLELPQRVIPVAGMCVGWPSEKGHISPRLGLSSTLHQGQYDEGNLAERIDAYDKRRAAIHPYKPRDPARWGEAAFYGWSEDKARQYGVPQRAGLRRVRAEEGIRAGLATRYALASSGGRREAPSRRIEAAPILRDAHFVRSLRMRAE